VAFETWKKGQCVCRAMNSEAPGAGKLDVIKTRTAHCP